jgi:hypothetical protein
MFADGFQNNEITNFSTTLSPGALSELYGDVRNSNGAVAAAWNIKAAPGSTGTGSATNSQQNAWAAILFGLKPACTARAGRQ